MKKLVKLTLLGAALLGAQDTKVTPLVTKALDGIPGKEATLSRVE